MEMRMIFVSNFLNPHQYPLAIELYLLTGGSFRFIELEQIPDSFVKSGYPKYGHEPWLIRTWESESARKEAEDLAIRASVMVAGGCASVERYVKRRLEYNRLTFKYSERWLKRGLINIISPNIFRPIISYLLRYRNKPYYLLCASAFAASDACKFGNFKDKAFKWGYFPKTTGAENEELNFAAFKEDTEMFKIMTVCRMLNWKRPKMMIEAAKYLNLNGINFIMDMYGSGQQLDRISKLIDEYALKDKVILHGNIPNKKIHEEMRRHHCLLITSNQREGWGAVVNEAMANGCVVVGASKIGSIPYLINDGINGIVFEDNSQDDLNSKLYKLAINPAECEAMARKGQSTIAKIWSPRQAAIRLLSLSESLNNGLKTPYVDGPCSVAPLL